MDITSDVDDDTNTLIVDSLVVGCGARDAATWLLFQKVT